MLSTAGPDYAVWDRILVCVGCTWYPGAEFEPGRLRVFTPRADSGNRSRSLLKLPSELRSNKPQQTGNNLRKNSLREGKKASHYTVHTFRRDGKLTLGTLSRAQFLEIIMIGNTLARGVFDQSNETMAPLTKSSPHS